ncbi:MAG TPA: beta-ketoacyl-[acyl-carrier-protein] synthase family protein [Phycisphaerae bacterium]|nr:beta-ketoacyl-[acyl-carrier-protein] synthase family protein [Phycisphaerae bacterium]HNU44362.1 beta-ketoacyl-[acyl-carrier-protein] synthase family protein [Phycisphaerae bacterium]
MPRRVVITGMGWVTPLGHDVETVWQRMLRGESGVGRTTRFDARTFPTTFSAEVKSFDLADFLGARAQVHAGAALNARFALAAAAQAWKSAGLAGFAGLQPERVGVYLGGGEGPIDFDPFVAAAYAGCRNDAGNATTLDTVRWARKAMQVFRAVSELEQDPNLAAAHLAVELNARGPGLSTLTACAASTQALGEATAIIRYGDADVMISGGTHSMLHPLGVTGFNRLTALSTRNDSPNTASRPFDRTRDGFVLGEGSGMLILEELEHALARGARPLAEITGFGSTADAFRITDMHEEGRGPQAAMRRALESAGVTVSDIDYISAHGTSTEENDKIESLAIREVFGPRAGQVPVSSVKSMVGHLIAAAGAVELITCVLAIRDGLLPPTINYATPDPNCPLDYVPNQARRAQVRMALSNSFGFGGQNDTLVVRAVEPG